MFGPQETDVLVVGAGPVGLVTALSLADVGVKVRIVDEERRVAAHSYALALHAESIRLLKRLGIATEQFAQAYRVHTAAFYDESRRRAALRLGDAGSTDTSVLVLRQDVLEGLLERRLEELGVHVEWNHRVGYLEPEHDRVSVMIDEREKVSSGYAVAHTSWSIRKTRKLRAAYVVGADGHRSRVRESLGIEYETAAAPVHFAVFEFQSDYDAGGEMRIVLGDDGAGVLWPLADGYCRWSFQLDESDLPSASREKSRLAVRIGEQTFAHLSPDLLSMLIKRRAPWFDGSLGDMKWSMAVRFENRLAQSFGIERCRLVGDAAHLTGPVGVQSMNVGFREAAELARLMADVLGGCSSPDSLDDYAARRMEEWRFLLGLEAGLRATDETDRWVAGHAREMLSCIPASGSSLVRLAAQLKLAAPRFDTPHAPPPR